MKWQPVDYIAAGLATSLVYAVIVMGIGYLLGIPMAPLESEELQLQLLLTITAMISMYIGAKVK